MDPDPRQIGDASLRDPHPHPARAPDNSGPGWGWGSGIRVGGSAPCGKQRGTPSPSRPGGTRAVAVLPAFPLPARGRVGSASLAGGRAARRLGRSLWGQARQPQAEGVLKRAFCIAYRQDLAEKGTRVGLGARPHSGTSKVTVTDLVSPSQLNRGLSHPERPIPPDRPHWQSRQGRSPTPSRRVGKLNRGVRAPTRDS
jgi:hypothetical protein